MSSEVMQAFLDSLTDDQKAKLNQLNELSKPIINKEEAVSSSKPRVQVNEDFTVVRGENYSDKRKTQVKAKNNQWSDTGEDRDPNFDAAKFERMGKAIRNRERTKKQSVDCHVCGRSIELNSNLVYGEFIRCNRCTGK